MRWTDNLKLGIVSAILLISACCYTININKQREKAIKDPHGCVYYDKDGYCRKYDDRE